MLASTSGIDRRWVVTWLLFGFMAINFMDKAVLGIAGERLQSDLGLSDTQFGLVSSTFFLAFTVSGFVVGWFADRFDPRLLLLSLVVVWSVAQLLVAIPGTGLTTLVLTRIMLGAAEGPAFALANHTVFTWFRDRERTLPSSILTMGAPAGIALGAPLLAVLVTHADWRAAFLLTGLIGLLWVAAWARGGGSGPFAVHTAAAGTHERADRWAGLFLRPTVWGAAIAGFAAYWTMAVAITWLPLYLQRARDWELTQAGGIAALTQLVGVAVIFSVGLASQRLHVRGVSSRISHGAVVAGALAVGGAAVLAVPRVPDGPVLLVTLLVAFTASSSTFSLIAATIAEVAPGRQRAAVLGTVTALSAAGGAFGPVIFGALVDAADSDVAGFTSAYTVGGVLLLVGAVVASLFINPDGDRRVLDAAQPEHVAAPTAARPA
ncbi:MFS transporter [Nocardioides sp. YIM 152588]|uniref:MFS transporter n=1 Tax=Nocardioides sp. YIM 152588 TaxID=3158259 RepID=UPI0032E40246